MKGAFYIGKHEGDTFHLLQIVLRMADGQWPHLDFMTPIGVLAFAPIVAFVSLGFGIGKAILLSQLLVSVALLPAVWWTAQSRMKGVLPYVFGLFVLVLVNALVHGEAQRSVSISMHYNRWAWAISFVAIALAVIPPLGRPRPWVDGALVGVALAALLLIKVTYLAAFGIPVALALMLRCGARAVAAAALAALAVTGLVTLLAGVEFWPRYLKDLLAVSLSDVRPFPGEPLGAIMGAPAYLGASLTLIMGVILLRQAREATGGLVLLLLMPGFFFVTYQNFGNDPQWLLLLGVLLIAFLPERDLRNGFGWNMRNALKMTAAIALAMAAPSFFNLAYSPFRHLAIDTADYTQLLPKATLHGDLKATKLRALRTDTRTQLDIAGTGLEAYSEEAGYEDPTVFLGEALPHCQLELGMSAWFDVIASDLAEAGLTQGKSIFAADLFSSHWLFGPSVPVPGGAPWYYGGLPGIRNADFLLVPLCPVVHEVRGKVLASVEEREMRLTEVRRTKLYVLYAIGEG